MVLTVFHNTPRFSTHYIRRFALRKAKCFIRKLDRIQAVSFPIIFTTNWQFKNAAFHGVFFPFFSINNDALHEQLNSYSWRSKKPRRLLLTAKNNYFTVSQTVANCITVRRFLHSIVSSVEHREHYVYVDVHSVSLLQRNGKGVY